jgi:hypothetical protein
MKCLVIFHESKNVKNVPYSRIAKGIHIDIGAKGVTAPAPMTMSKEIRDMIPKSDAVVRIDILNSFNHSGYIGYIAVFCENFDKPKAWAYYLPESDSEDMDYLRKSNYLWPILEMDYLDYMNNLKPYISKLKSIITQRRIEHNKTREKENKF